MIGRIWHGYTTFENANAYEALLLEEIFVEIERRQIPGYLGIKLLRREVLDEVEFITIMMFTSLDAVQSFAGENYEIAVVPQKARKLLKRFDKQSQHYDVIINTSEKYKI
ncbi:MAG: antibiotic biosynthesis monooxygenase [Asgard group archaeon]|nr:antibiotic biosynthesis monooxygenase [Asgard group archaeon]